jgi:hypothetical protein
VSHAGSATAHESPLFPFHTLPFWGLPEVAVMKMKTNPLTLSVLGIVAILATTFIVLQQRRLAQSRAEIDRLRRDTAPLAEIGAELARLRHVEVDLAELARLREKQASNLAELLRLRAQAAQTLRAEAEAANLRTELEHQTAEGSQTTGGITAPTAELMQGAMEQRASRQVTRLQERLTLSPAQTQAIQEILTRRAQGIAEATKGVITGKLDRQKLAAFRQGNGDSEAQILAWLSPEQQTAYAAFKEEERLKQASSTANSELVQMQHTLDLWEHQQDKVFAILYEQALQRSEAGADDPEPANPAEAEQTAMDRKLQALESVLTPTQLTSYRQQQELHLRYMRQIVSQMETATAEP